MIADSKTAQNFSFIDNLCGIFFPPGTATCRKSVPKALNCADFHSASLLPYRCCFTNQDSMP